MQLRWVALSQCSLLTRPDIGWAESCVCVSVFFYHPHGKPELAELEFTGCNRTTGSFYHHLSWVPRQGWLCWPVQDTVGCWWFVTWVGGHDVKGRPCSVPQPFCTLKFIDVPLGGWGTWLHGQALVQGKFSNLDLDSDLDG